MEKKGLKKKGLKKKSWQKRVDKKKVEEKMKKLKKVGKLKKKVEKSVKTRGLLNERAAWLFFWAKDWWIVRLKEDTTPRHKKLHKQNYTARPQPRKGSYGHIRPAPWQHARHGPGTPHACHRWRRLGFSRQLAHGRHHTSAILDRNNPTSWKCWKMKKVGKIQKSWKKVGKIFKKKYM